MEKTIPLDTTIRSVAALYPILFAQLFLPTELAVPLIVAVGFSVIVLTSGWQERNYYWIGLPLLAVSVIGLPGVVEHEPRHLLRDIAFALSPIALTFTGYWLAGNAKIWPLMMKTIMVLGFFVAARHLMVFVENPDLLNASIEEVREQAGKGSVGLGVLCLAVGLFQNRFRMGDIFPSWLPRPFVLAVCFASFVLTFSRTETAVLLLLLLSLLGWFSQLKLSSMSGLAALVVVASAIILSAPDDEADTFRSKLARSPAEMFSANFQDEQAINDNWRAFETSRVIDSFSASTVSEQIFGQGFGTLVDMGLEMNLGGEILREIPIFHNGYAYILIKTGVLGLICYALFYISVIRFALLYCNSRCTEQRGFARLLLGCVLSLMLMMYVIGGMAESAGTVLVLLLGYLVRKINMLQIEIECIDAGKKCK